MMVSRYYPADWATLRGGVYAWIKSQTSATVVWAAQDAPSPATKPWVRLDMIVPPVSDGQAEHRDIALVEVDEVADDTLYEITINGLDTYGYLSDASATANEIRDGLIVALVSSDVAQGVLLPDLGDGRLAVVPRVGYAKPLITVGALLRPRLVIASLVDGIATFSVDVFGGDDPARLASKLEQSLDHATVRAALQASGWSTVSIEGVRASDTVAGARWEGRAGFDARLRCRKRGIEVNDYIESVGQGALSGTVTS